jgi:hypothetical protein
MKYIWDYIFGTVLIGGAPLIVFFGLGSLLCYIEKFAPEITNSPFSSYLILALSVFSWFSLIRYRSKKRILSRRFLVTEIISAFIINTAIFAALIILMFLGGPA